MRATDFEFRNRFWTFALTYGVGFGLYRVDHVNVIEALLRWKFGQSDPHRTSLAARHALQAAFAISATIIGAGAWIRTWGGAYLRSEVVHDSRVHSDRLVADGPYRHVRNPLYFGNMLLAIGLAMEAGRSGAAVLILGNLLIVLRLIGREEAALTQSQGESYRSFLATVPRLWPSLAPRVPAGDMKPAWLQAFAGEGWMWLFAVNTFIFAWNLDGRLYSTLMWSSIAGYFLAWHIVNWSRRRKRASG